MTARTVRLPDRFYLPRTDAEGREVRDVMPWEGAVSYATDGERLGIQYADGRVEWLGRADRTGDGDDDGDGDDTNDGTGDGDGVTPEAAARTFADDFEGVDIDALVAGIRSYIDLHPVLRTVWRDDVESLEGLRGRGQS